MSLTGIVYEIGVIVAVPTLTANQACLIFGTQAWSIDIIILIHFVLVRTFHYAYNQHNHPKSPQYESYLPLGR